MRKHLPNILTLGNLFCGMLAIRLFFLDTFDWPLYLLGIAALLDFADGLVARSLKVSGELGKQLDSLADVVSFGVAPAIGLSQYFYYEVGLSPENGWQNFVIVFSPYLIALFSALRLAKFNIDTRQTDRFIGLPTPANTLFIGSLIWALHHRDLDLMLIYDYLIFLVPAISILSSWALVAEWKLLALKFKTWKRKGNEARYMLIGGSLIIFAYGGISGLSIVVLLYLLISFIEHKNPSP